MLCGANARKQETKAEAAQLFRYTEIMGNQRETTGRRKGARVKAVPSINLERLTDPQVPPEFCYLKWNLEF